MGVIVKIEDFENGTNQVAFSTSQEKELNGFIDQFEKPYLCRILGIELAEEMLVDALANNGDPVDANLLEIFNPLVIKYRRKVRSSNGIKAILKGFIKAEYVKELQITQTTDGNVVTTGKNSIDLLTAEFGGYNEQIIQSKAIQAYCKNDALKYPTYEGEQLETIDPLW